MIDYDWLIDYFIDFGLCPIPALVLSCYSVYELGCDIGSVTIDCFAKLVLLAYHVYCILIV